MNKLKDEKTESENYESKDEKDYEQIIKTHSKFSGFVEPVSFEAFLNTYTVECETKVTIASPPLDEDSVLINKICNAFSDPDVLELISKKLLQTFD